MKIVMYGSSLFLSINGHTILDRQKTESPCDSWHTEKQNDHASLDRQKTEWSCDSRETEKQTIIRLSANKKQNGHAILGGQKTE